IYDVAVAVDGGRVGQRRSVILTISDQFGRPGTGMAGDLEMWLEGANGDAAISAIIEERDGRYRVSFTPTRAGVDQIWVSLFGEIFGPVTTTTVEEDGTHPSDDPEPDPAPDLVLSV